MVWKGHKLSPTCLTVKDDESKIFSGGKDCAVIEWDVETGGKKTVFAGGRKNFDCGGHFE